MEVFHCPKGNTVPRKQSISIGQPLATSNLSLWICLLQMFHMNGILLSAGPLWPASFTEQDVFKVHRIVASVSHLFLFVAEYYSEVRIYHTLLIHPLDDGIWVVFTFWLSQIMLLHSRTSTGLSVCTQFAGFITRRGIAASYGHAKLNVQRNCHAVFPGGCTTLHCRR